MKNFYTKGVACAAFMVMAAFATSVNAQTFEDVEYGKSYQISSKEPVYLTINLNVPGTLMVQQWGTTDSHIFTTKDPASIESAVPSDTYEKNWDGGYDLPYTLRSGTYYFIAPFNYDDIKEAIINFTPEGAGDLIQEGVPYIAGPQNPEGVFESFVNGILTVSTDSPDNLNEFLYEDSDYSTPLKCTSWETTPLGSEYKYEVKANTSYFLHYTGKEDVTFTFTVEKTASSEKVSVTAIYPLPGYSYNPFEYPEGPQVVFNPSEVDFSEITFTYTPEGSDTPVTETVTGSEFMGGSLRVNIRKIYEIAANTAAEDSYCTITIKNVNYDGSPLTSSSVRGATVIDGNLSFDYLITSAPVLVNAEMPENFYKSWPAGSADAKVVFTFNKPIGTASELNIMYGHYVPSPENTTEYVTVAYAPDIRGNVVTYDLSGNHLDIFNQPVPDYRGKEVTLYVNNFMGDSGLTVVFDSNEIYYIKYLPYVNEVYEGNEDPEPGPGEEPDHTYMEPAANVGNVGKYTSYLSTVILSWDYTPIDAVDELYVNVSYEGGAVEKVTDVSIQYVNPDSEGGEPGIMSRAEEEEAGNVLYIVLDKFEKGNYIVSVPEGIVMNMEGAINEAQSFEFNVVEVLQGTDATYTPSNNSELTAGDAIVTATWEGYDDLVHNGDAQNVTADSSNGERLILNYGAQVNINENALTIDLSQLETGKYSITIPEAYVVMNNNTVVNGEWYLNYTIADDDAGVEGISADKNGIYNVYDVKGVKVAETKNVNELKQLAPGLYIINGQKVYLKK